MLQDAAFVSMQGEDGVATLAFLFLPRPHARSAGGHQGGSHRCPSILPLDLCLALFPLKKVTGAAPCCRSRRPGSLRWVPVTAAASVFLQPAAGPDKMC